MTIQLNQQTKILVLLVFEGGVGIEKNLNVGGDMQVTGISTFIGGIKVPSAIDSW